MSLARIVALGFITAMIGTQLATPLLPAYGKALGVGVGAVTTAYSTFLFVLVPVFAIFGTPRLQRHPLWLVGGSLAAAAAADIVYLTHTYLGLLIGRGLNGVSLGLGAGAAAALTLALIGERGRTMVATVTIIGALVGTGGTVVIAELTSTPLLTGYFIHLALVVVTAIIFVAGLRRGLRIPIRGDAVVPDVGGGGRVAPVWVGFVIGALAFTVGGVLSTLIPVATADALSSSSFIVANASALGMLATANVVQYALVRVPLRWAVVISATTGTLGPAAAVWGVHEHAIGWIVAGGLLGGIGQGLGYRTGMKIVTRGLAPRQQGGRTSTYSCVTYATCALMVVGVGAVLAGPQGFSMLWIVPLVLLLPSIAITLGTFITRGNAR